jgi:hypothetical protein
VAQHVQVILVDDLDGGTAEETVPFSLDGVGYEIDLSRDNAKRLRDALSPFIGSARRAGGARATRTRGRGAAAKASAGNTAQIREWARSKGHKVSDRGRIPATIVAEYEQAHAS